MPRCAASGGDWIGRRVQVRVDGILLFGSPKEAPSSLASTKRTPAETYVMLDGAGVLVTGGKLKGSSRGSRSEGDGMDRASRRAYRN